MRKDLGTLLNQLIVEARDLANRQQQIEKRFFELDTEIQQLLSARRSDESTNLDSEYLEKYRFEFDYVFPSLPDLADWRGHLLDENHYILCEVWNNGDGGGNWDVWHNGEARWAIEAQAVTEFPPVSKVENSGKAAATELAPMDAWIARVIGNARGNLGR